MSEKLKTVVKQNTSSVLEVLKSLRFGGKRKQEGGKRFAIF